MVDPDAAAPLFSQIRDLLRTRILEGSLSEGEKLPSEGSMEKQFGVSRITVRQALAQLHAEGLIEKINGKGSFVKRVAPAPVAGTFSGYYEVMRHRGYRVIGTVSPVKHLPAPESVAAALRIPPQSPIASVTITRMIDDEPNAYQTCYASAGLITELTGQDLSTNDLSTVLMRLGYQIICSDIECSAVAADAASAKRLGVSRGSPLLRLRVVTRDQQDVPLMYNEFFARGDRYSYRHESGRYSRQQ